MRIDQRNARRQESKLRLRRRIQALCAGPGVVAMLFAIGCASSSEPESTSSKQQETAVVEAADKGKSLVTVPVDSLRFTDVESENHEPFEDTSTKAIVLVFIATDCPIANYYQPTLARLAKDYTDDGIRFFHIHSDPDLDREAALKHAEEFATVSPVVMDQGQSIARLVSAKMTPEAHLIDPKGNVRYRGRINDLYVDYGKRRHAATSNDLQDAIEALVRGNEIVTSTTKAVGCYIPYPSELQMESSK